MTAGAVGFAVEQQQASFLLGGKRITPALHVLIVSTVVADDRPIKVCNSLADVVFCNATSVAAIECLVK